MSQAPNAVGPVREAVYLDSGLANLPDSSAEASQPAAGTRQALADKSLGCEQYARRLCLSSPYPYILYFNAKPRGKLELELPGTKVPLEGLADGDVRHTSPPETGARFPN